MMPPPMFDLSRVDSFFRASSADPGPLRSNPSWADTSRRAVPYISALESDPSAPTHVVGRSSPPAVNAAPMAIHQRSSNTRDPFKASTDQNFRFFIVKNPKDLKDKNQMRANRQHVMFNFLDKNSHESGNRDPRVKRRRRRTSGAPGAASVPLLGHTATEGQALVVGPSRLNPSSVCSNTSSEGSSRTSNHPTAGRFNGLYWPTRSLDPASAAELNLSVVRDDCHALLYTPIYCHGALTLYLATRMVDTFSCGDGFGGRINPFDTWPPFSNPRVEVERLKFICSLRFGSEAITRHWIPALLRARHSFYSSICISAAHDDIMNRSLRPFHRLAESFQRMAVRDGIIRMINECLDDPISKMTDETLIAILQALYGELMGGEQEVIEAHQNGLATIVTMRGGLDKLGVAGQLAGMLTVTNYLIASMNERPPDSMYASYARNTLTVSPPDDAKHIPESPVYSPRDFAAVQHSIGATAPKIQILQLTREATQMFTGEYHVGMRVPALASSMKPNINGGLQSKLLDLRRRVFSLDNNIEGVAQNTADAHVFEAIRLASCVYIHALAYGMPISHAAAALRYREGVETQPSDTSTTAAGSPRAANRFAPIHVRIQAALQSTVVEELWGPLAGVLYWVVLVGCAAASNNGPGGGRPGDSRVGDPGGADISAQTDRHTELEEHEAHRWLTAVLVRCTVILGFEHNAAILRTLTRFVGIQRMLDQKRGERGEGGDEQRPATAASAAAAATATPGYGHRRATASRPRKRRMGPEPPPVGLDGFAYDFADRPIW